MPVHVVVGLGWGDEGKGKVVDLLSKNAGHIVRGQGGNNAGHTVKFEGREFFLHHIPSGILSGKNYCYIGGGTVIEPSSLLEEIHTLEQQGIQVKERLFLSKFAHVIFPFHIMLDRVKEMQASETRRIGTTGKGIGPCYTDAVARIGLRVGDILEKSSKEKIIDLLNEKNKQLKTLYDFPTISLEEIEKQTIAPLQELSSYVADVEEMLHHATRLDEVILVEGAQGALLDVTFGTYPYVTSSSTLTSGVLAGCGMGPIGVEKVIGVVKAYATRVGEGPFPTEGELFPNKNKEIREVGVTTGRNRRIGWFDAVLTRQSVRHGGANSIALTKLDILSFLEKIYICTAYEIDGKVVTSAPSSMEKLREAKPIYEEMPGWQESLQGKKRLHELPQNAKLYLDKLEELLETPIDIVSVGPEREETIIINE